MSWRRFRLCGQFARLAVSRIYCLPPDHATFPRRTPGAGLSAVSAILATVRPPSRGLRFEGVVACRGLPAGRRGASGQYASGFLRTGVLAGFDHMPPLQDQPHAADYFENCLHNTQAQPLRHHRHHGHPAKIMNGLTFQLLRVMLNPRITAKPLWALAKLRAQGIRRVPDRVYESLRPRRRQRPSPSSGNGWTAKG